MCGLQVSVHFMGKSAYRLKITLNDNISLFSREHVCDSGIDFLRVSIIEK